MRLRNNPKAKEILSNNKQYLNNEYDNTLINNDIFNTIYLEIGCGKGKFISKLATDNPTVMCIGIDKFLTILLKASNKIKNINNAFLLNADASNLCNYFLPNSVDKIFLNFSDPWPKKRHIKKRLTSPAFIDIYKKILKPDGVVEFKTDNDNLYDYSLYEVLFNRNDVMVLYHTTNLYANLGQDINTNNIPTEYEQKFVNMNKNINKIVFKYI